MSGFVGKERGTNSNSRRCGGEGGYCKITSEKEAHYFQLSLAYIFLLLLLVWRVGGGLVSNKLYWKDATAQPAAVGLPANTT